MPIPFLRFALSLVSALAAASLIASARGQTGGTERGATELVLEVEAVRLAPDGRDRATGLVSGRAFAHSGQAPRFDVVFAIDVSGSTGASSGADIDGDGKVAGGFGLGRIFGSRDAGGDSILAAEVAAVRALLDTFDPRTTRAGLVAFAGTPGAGGDHAWVEVPLTDKYRELRRALDDVLLAGAEGGTNMEAGLRSAAKELFGSRLARSDNAPQKHIVLLSDGEPTLPERSSATPEERAVRAARVLGRRGAHVHAFAVGREAARNPRATRAVAEASGGSFRAVPDPGQLSRLLTEVRFASIERLGVRNLTTGRDARELVHKADGGFAALVPVEPGENRIEIFARASDGTERRLEVTRHLAVGALDARAEADLARLLAQRGQRREDDSERGLDVRIED